MSSNPSVWSNHLVWFIKSVWSIQSGRSLYQILQRLGVAQAAVTECWSKKEEKTSESKRQRRQKRKKDWTVVITMANYTLRIANATSGGASKTAWANLIRPWSFDSQIKVTLPLPSPEKRTVLLSQMIRFWILTKDKEWPWWLQANHLVGLKLLLVNFPWPNVVIID